MKYRIYDKKNNEYCEEPDHRWMLSRQGRLYNSENDEWYKLGERYIVEFFTELYDKFEEEIYEGDVLDGCNDYRKQPVTSISDLWKQIGFYNVGFIKSLEIVGNVHGVEVN